MRNPDVVVVGGGPVGMAAAVGARLAGLGVVVVEPRQAPIDKACGEGLMPGAVEELRRLGVSPRGHAITGITYRDGHRVARHEFRDATGRGVRRTELSRSLHDRAEELGVTLVDARLTGLIQDARGVTITLGDGSNIRSRWLIGCDGLHSVVRRLAGLESASLASARLEPVGASGVGTSAASAGRRADRRYGLRRHYRVAPWTSQVEVHWSAGYEVYATPIDDDLVGVAMLGPRGLELDAAIAAIPSLAAQLQGAVPEAPTSGAGPLLQRVRAHAIGRVLLAGDASGYIDALTGEGMRIGFAQAAAAVRVVAQTPDGAADDAARAAQTDYERAWRRASTPANRLTSGLLAASQSPVRGMLVPVAARFPQVFGAAVERIAR